MTSQQSRLLAFLKAEAAQGRTPSYDEMCEHMGLASKSGIHRLVEALEARGKVRRTYGRWRSIKIIPETVSLHLATTDELFAELQSRGINFANIPASHVLERVG